MLSLLTDETLSLCTKGVRLITTAATIFHATNLFTANKFSGGNACALLNYSKTSVTAGANYVPMSACRKYSDEKMNGDTEEKSCSSRNNRWVLFYLFVVINRHKIFLENRQGNQLGEFLIYCM